MRKAIEDALNEQSVLVLNIEYNEEGHIPRSLFEREKAIDDYILGSDYGDMPQFIRMGLLDVFAQGKFKSANEALQTARKSIIQAAKSRGANLIYCVETDIPEAVLNEEKAGNVICSCYSWGYCGRIK